MAGSTTTIVGNSAYTLIIPVWGSYYVARWAEEVLPSWLAGGNLPAIAAAGSLTVLVLTDEAGRERLGKRGPALEALRQLGSVETVPIDDLVPGGIASVTLTLAFARGAQQAYDHDPSARLIFLNGDFVLSDGSLRSVAEAFDRGESLQLCTSLRVDDGEDFGRLLERHREETGAITLPAVDALADAFRYLHATVQASRWDQALLRSAHPNQFFWRPEPSLLLARSSLLFPLAVAPSEPPAKAATYCDYGWIATMAPAATPFIHADSDGFLALEASAPEQERNFLLNGPPDPDDAARVLSAWSTEFNRRQLETLLVYRAGDGPAPSASVARQTLAEVNQVLGKAGPPVERDNHPYFVRGLAIWLKTRVALSLAVPEELDAGAVEAARGHAEGAGRARLSGKGLLVGVPGARRFWHPLWRLEKIAGEEFGIAGGGDWQLLLPSAPSEGGVPFLDPDGDFAPSALGRAALAGAVVAGRMPSDSRPIGPDDRLTMLGALDADFDIAAATALADNVDLQAVRAYRALGDRFALSRSGGRLALALAAGFSLLRLLLANSTYALAARRPSSAKAVLLLLEVKSRPSAGAAPTAASRRMPETPHALGEGSPPSRYPGDSLMSPPPEFARHSAE